MTDIAIRVEKLGKQYYIGKRERYHALRDTLTDAISDVSRDVIVQKIKDFLRG